MPSIDQAYQDALNQGYSPQEINAYLGQNPAGQKWLQQKQMTGALREPAMVGSEALSGLMGVGSLPAEGINALTQKVINPEFGTHLGTMETPLQFTNQMGLTNNPSLIPQGEGEQLMAGAARGVGAAVPSLLIGGPAGLTLGAGAVGGTAAEAAHQVFPNSTLAPVLAGTVAGLGSGIVGSQFQAGAGKVFQGIAEDLGAGDATIPSAGAELQNALNIKALGIGTPTNLPHNDLTRLLNAKPAQVGESLLRDPASLQILRNEMPDQVDQLAGAMLRRNAPQFNNLYPESQEALFPDSTTRDVIGRTLKANSPGMPEKMAGYVLGGGIGAAAGHLGLLPGDVLGGFMGEGAGLVWHQLMNRAAARSILGPWMYGATGAGVGAGMGQAGQ